MTRFERIQDYLRAVGPRSTRQISQHFGWAPVTTSAVVSHARSYGYIKAHGAVPPASHHGGSPMTIWRHCDVIIRYPSETREALA